MKVTREHVERQAAAAKATAAPRIAALAPGHDTAIVGLVAGGASIAVAGAEPLLVAAGVILAVIGAHRLGRFGRGTDPRVDGLTRDRDSWRNRATLLAAELAGGAPGERGEIEPDPRGEPRPSAGIRGGGRPGSVAAFAPIESPLDRAIAGEGADQ